MCSIVWFLLPALSEIRPQFHHINARFFILLRVILQIVGNHVVFPERTSEDVFKFDGVVVILPMLLRLVAVVVVHVKEDSGLIGMIIHHPGVVYAWHQERNVRNELTKKLN